MSGENFSKYLKIRSLNHFAVSIFPCIFAIIKEIEMKGIDFLDEEIKKKIAKITKSILDINASNTTTYIKLSDDEKEILLDEYFTVETGTPITYNDSFKYLKMDMPDMPISDKMVKSYLKNIEIIKRDEDEEYINTPTEEDKYEYIYNYIFRKIRMKEVMVQILYTSMEYEDNKYQD